MATIPFHLTLVDLAGSKKSVSIWHLYLVALRIPYCNLKMTYLVQPCIGGDSKVLSPRREILHGTIFVYYNYINNFQTCMFVNISPLESNMAETVSTLEFGQNASQVELGKATKHVTKGS